MKSRCAWSLVTLAAVVLPTVAAADARHHPGLLGRAGASIQHGGRGHAHHGRPHRPGRRHHHHRRHGGVSPGIVLWSSVVYAAPPVALASSLDHAPPPASYPPAAPAVPPVATAPATPAVPQVAEFDTGRYELRGDGVREPYLWVWVPKAPAAPPGDPPPRRRPATVYRWIDDEGVMTLTDDPTKVPPQFRALEITPRP
jgi:hypothetical protein